ncbi:MAG: hypothetical protein LBL19_01910 [Spirochaetaceae bacterium]|jgi:YD repeat-containing protein|nr:hypothetical protein [Spirochaetaceae bacterium]
MKVPAILLLAMVFLTWFPVWGEETINPAEAGEELRFFPVNALLIALGAPELGWRPDWPLSMPPDAFMVEQGRPSSITLTLDSGDVRLTRNRDGLPVDFPFWFQGNFIQSRLDLEESGKTRMLVMEKDLAPWYIELIGGDDPAMGIRRIIRGEDVFFDVIQNNSLTGDIETWYDRDGNPRGVWTYVFDRAADGSPLREITARTGGGEIRETYDYDSFGNLSGITSPRGRFSALYVREGRPRYAERWTLQVVPAEEGEGREGEEPVLAEFYQSYRFQWDEGGFLVRVTGTPGPGEEDPVDFRYDYTLDEKGNWIERRETRMIPRFGMLLPGPETRILRTIEYEPED